MKYDFDKVISRRESNCCKWAVGPNELPMWVADMDFEASPAIKDAIRKCADHGVYGYSYVTDEWYEAYINWWQTRHDFTIEKEWLMFCTGVIPALSSIIRKLATPYENIIVQSPVYNNFFSTIESNGNKVLENKLINKDDVFSIDFEDLEKKMADPQSTIFVLCNPQNPSGTIWSKEDLAKIGDLAVKHGVIVVSDEIHCDVTIPGKKYVPFASVSENCKNCSITLIAPTKCFNIAGIKTSAIFVSNPFLRDRVNRAIRTDNVEEPNAFAVAATVAAFNESGDWLDEVNAYIAENRQITYDFIKKEIPGLSAVEAEATYLVWINLTKLDVNVPSGIAKGDYVADRLRKNTGLFLNKGSVYGSGGEDYLRLNVACPRSLLMDGLDRLKKGIDSIR